VALGSPFHCVHPLRLLAQLPMSQR
jgi:hypothetical protein